MAVLINFKICDNAKECNGIAVCPTGALSWDEKKGGIKIDNKKCISCGKCEKACMVDAIKVARDAGEYKKIEKEIAADPRKGSDLLIDRYGAQPVHPAFQIKEDKFDLEVLQSDNKIVAVEFFNDDSIMCLLHSIPFKQLIDDASVKYRKLKVENNGLIKKYKITKLPSLLFFKNGKLLDKIEGYYGVADKKQLKEKIFKIIN